MEMIVEWEKIMNVTTKSKLEVAQDMVDCYTSNTSYSKVVKNTVSGITKDSANFTEVLSSAMESDIFCRRVHDGYTCWDATPAGWLATLKCPGSVTGFDPKRSAFRACHPNGTWDYSVYTGCIDSDDLYFREIVNNIYVTGYSISLICLVVALGIFAYFPGLMCARIKIHINLFISHLLVCISWILWYKTVVNNADVILANGLYCQTLHVLVKYFTQTNYYWMLCESLNLHFSLVVVFIDEDSLTKWFMLLGWVFPILLTAAYGGTRYSFKSMDHCWVEDSDASKFFTIPGVISIAISFCILINVLRIMAIKIRGPHYRTGRAMLKAARSALILVPLFGVQFILLPMRPAHGTLAEKIYEIFAAVITSPQGACVTTLYCFTNAEVHLAFKARFSRTRDLDLPMSGLSGGDSAMTYARDNVP